MHKQRFAASGGILKAEFIQVIFFVESHIGEIDPMPVESLYKAIEVGK